MDTDATITATVRALMYAHGLTGEQLAKAVGMTRSTMYRHLREGGWWAKDVQTIADFFGVAVAEIFDGLGGRLAFAQPAPVGVGVTDQYHSWAA